MKPSSQRLKMLEDNLYLDNLQEFVQDESMIVSYKWLSRKLEVPADAAKRMLYSYVEQCRSSEPCSITVIYTVTGLIDTNHGKSQRVCLVSEDELEATKKDFNPVRSVHIYSVQQASIKDSSTLFMADYDMCKDHTATYSRWSPIRCTAPANSITSSHSENLTNTTTTQSTMKTEDNTTKSRSVKYQFPDLKERNDENTEKDVLNVVQKETKSLSRRIENKKSGGKQHKAPVRGSMESFFKPSTTSAKKVVTKSIDKPAIAANNATADNSITVGDKTTADNSITADKSTTAPNNATALEHSNSESDMDVVPNTHPQTTPKTQLEAKPNSQPRKTERGGKNRRDKLKSSPVKALSHNQPELTSEKKDKCSGLLNDSDIDNGSDSDGESVISANIEPKSSKKMNGEKKHNVKSISEKVKGVALQRKRKRIQNMSSDEEDNDATTMQTEEEATKETPGRKRKRVKRLKTKMYTTDDGAMVTEKVWESESADESDTDIKSSDVLVHTKTNKSPTKERLNQSSPAKGTKQSLLVNFFKK